MIEMVVKKKDSVFGEQKTPEIQLPKWMLTKWFLYIATAVMIVLFVGFSLPASTRDNIASAIFAKTATDVSVVKPPSGVENPLVIGTATPTQNGKEKTVNKFYNKFEQNIYVDLGKTGMERVADINDIPQEFPLGNKVFLTNLKISPEKISGYIDNRDIATHRLRLKILFYPPDGKIIDGKSSLSAVDGDQIDVYDVMPGEKRFFQKSPGGSGSQQGRKIYDGLKNAKFIAIGVELH